MDSTLALGAFGIARGAGGEGVDVNGNLVEREKGDEFGIETPASSSTIACGQQKGKGGNGSITASISTSIIASIIALIIGPAPKLPIKNLSNLRRFFLRRPFGLPTSEG